MPHKLYNVVCLRSNPRSKEYMLSLLHEKFPEAEILVSKAPEEKNLIILLYPDAIGLGWGKIERQYKRRFKNITVLNGRGRIFTLDASTYTSLKVKRFLEITFLPELILTPFLFMIGVALALKDKISGRS